MSRKMRVQQHKMSLPPLPTTALAIIINWVQRMGQIPRHCEKVSNLQPWPIEGGCLVECQVGSGREGGRGGGGISAPGIFFLTIPHPCLFLPPTRERAPSWQGFSPSPGLVDGLASSVREIPWIALIAFVHLCDQTE